MRILPRIGLLLVQLAAFIVLTAAASRGWSYLTAERYGPGDTPGAQFPVVAVPPGGAQVQLLTWPEAAQARRADPRVTFRVPQPAGRLALPKRGGFKVLEATPAGQLVEVTWAGDDYERTSRYETDGTTVKPQSLRTWGPSSMLAGIVPGLLGAWLLGWLARRMWPTRARPGTGSS